MTALLERKQQNHFGKAQKLEQFVKNWKKAAVEDMAKASDRCFDTFNEYQMAIANIQDPEEKKEQKLISYKIVIKILQYIETKGNHAHIHFLLTECKPFAKLIEHYNKFCAKVESKYDVELYIEKKIRSNKPLYQKIKSLLK